MKELSLLRRVIPAKVQQAAGRAALKLDKASPQILFAAGIVGFGATVVLASTATLRVEGVLDEFNEKQSDMEEALRLAPDRYTQDEYNQDLIYIYLRAGYSLAKLYGPAILVGAASVACLTKSHSILNGRNAALTAAYAGLDKAFSNYRERVGDEVGVERERELYAGGSYQTELIRDPDGTGEDAVEVVRFVPDTNRYSPYARFFDETNPNWSRDRGYNLIFLRAQQSYANQMLQARGHIFLNEVYDNLGFDHSSAGAVVGWVLNKNGDNFVDFGFLSGQTAEARAFVNNQENSVILDFNVDGVIYDKI
jgi:hypothetical protein